MAKIEENELFNKFDTTVESALSFLRENQIRIRIDMNSISSQFYVRLEILRILLAELKDSIGIDDEMVGLLINRTLDTIKADIMETVGKEAADA